MSSTTSTSITPVLLAIWERDLVALTTALNRTPTDAFVASAAGVSPLSLCFRLRFLQGAELLLAAGASLTIRDAAGSLPPLYWAIASHSHTAISAVVAATTEASSASSTRARALCAALSSSPDFTAKLLWGIKIPSLLAAVIPSCLLPCDEFVINKRGGSLEAFFTLSGFTKAGVQRGNFSLLIAHDTFVIIDHTLKRWANVTENPPLNDGTEATTVDELSSARWPSIRSLAGSKSALRETRIRSGILASLLGAGAVKTRAIGPWPETRCWKLEGVGLKFLVREPLNGGGEKTKTATSGEQGGETTTTANIATTVVSAAGEGARIHTRASSRVGATIANFFIRGARPTNNSSGGGGGNPVSSSPAGALPPQAGCSLARVHAVSVLGLGAEGLLDRTFIAPPPIRTVDRSFDTKICVAPWSQVPFSSTILMRAIDALLGSRGADATAAVTSIQTFLNTCDGLPVLFSIALIPSLGVKAYVKFQDLSGTTTTTNETQFIGLPADFTNATHLWHANTFFGVGVGSGGSV